MSDLGDMFDVLRGCCLHDPQWLPADVASEIRWHGNRQSESDSHSIIVVRLKPKPGQRPHQADYGLLTQSEDYTGHGCQCNSMTAREPTLGKLLSHLDDYELTILLAGEPS